MHSTYTHAHDRTRAIPVEGAVDTNEGKILNKQIAVEKSKL